MGVVSQMISSNLLHFIANWMAVIAVDAALIPQTLFHMVFGKRTHQVLANHETKTATVGSSGGRPFCVGQSSGFCTLAWEQFRGTCSTQDPVVLLALRIFMLRDVEGKVRKRTCEGGDEEGDKKHEEGDDFHASDVEKSGVWKLEDEIDGKRLLNGALRTCNNI